MNLLSSAQTELQVIVKQAERRANTLRAQLTAVQPSTHQAHLHDHRTAVAGDMADALDRVQPGLGSRWMQAMYPEVNLSERVL